MQLKIESFEVRRVNTHKDIEELAIDTFIVRLSMVFNILLLNVVVKSYMYVIISLFFSLIVIMVLMMSILHKAIMVSRCLKLNSKRRSLNIKYTFIKTYFVL